MTTKQAEELTGMSRQNIRYYERMGLLEPARDSGNAYRDYSEEDIRRLKLIRMLRMLDMPLKDIEDIVNGKVTVKQAAKNQRELLLARQKQLSAAIEVCGSIGREKGDQPDVDIYLKRMELMEKNGKTFARFVDDYKQVAMEERERSFSFYTDVPVNTADAFEQVLSSYAAKQNQKFRTVKKGKYPEFLLGTEMYRAVRVVERDRKGGTAVKIICEKKDSKDRKMEIPERRRTMLRGIHIVTTNIRRYRKKSILNFLLSMMSVTVLAFYLGAVGSGRELLEKMPQEYTISGEIWNMCGEQKSGLFISHQVLEALYEAQHITSIAESSELFGTLSGEETTGKECSVTGINRPDCLEGMTEQDLILEEGMDWSLFLESDGDCIISDCFAEETGLEPGDDMEIALERYSQGLAGVRLTREELLPEQFHIVGIYKEQEGREGGNPDILLPLDTVKKIYEENGKAYFASALSFEVTDPMQLNAAKEELEQAGLKEILYGSPSSYVGASVKLTDSVFIRSMERADRNLRLLEGFLPFIMLLAAAEGYLIPSLLFQNRKPEYAVMRALGTGRYFCSFLLFAEHIVTAAGGTICGAAAGAAAGAVSAGGVVLVIGMYLMFYTLGAAAAMWKFGRFRVAAVLSHRD